MFLGLDPTTREVGHGPFYSLVIHLCQNSGTSDRGRSISNYDVRSVGIRARK